MNRFPGNPANSENHPSSDPLVHSVVYWDEEQPSRTWLKHIITLGAIGLIALVKVIWF